ncbi:MAG: hypothetical protein IOC55_14165 [Methylobacterium sp.]|nr:hypothetical protein [Methylobacterium sp.]
MFQADRFFFAAYGERARACCEKVESGFSQKKHAIIIREEHDVLPSEHIMPENIFPKKWMPGCCRPLRGSRPPATFPGLMNPGMRGDYAR